MDRSSQALLDHAEAVGDRLPAHLQGGGGGFPVPMRSKVDTQGSEVRCTTVSAHEKGSQVPLCEKGIEKIVLHRGCGETDLAVAGCPAIESHRHLQRRPSLTVGLPPPRGPMGGLTNPQRDTTLAQRCCDLRYLLSVERFSST